MNVILDDTEHDSSLIKSIALFFEKEDYLDVTFVCKGGQKVKAHRLVLSAVSPFLKSLFAEWNENQEIVLLVPDIDHDILKLVFVFMYEGTMKLSHAEYIEFKAALKMLKIRFPGAIVDERPVQAAPNRPPPLLKLDRVNRMHLGRQSNAVSRKGTETASIANDRNPSEANQSFSNLQDPLIGDRRSRDPVDDPLNVPDYYFVPPSIAESAQIHAAGTSNNPGTSQLVNQTSKQTGEVTETNYQERREDITERGEDNKGGREDNKGGRDDNKGGREDNKGEGEDNKRGGEDNKVRKTKNTRNRMKDPPERLSGNMNKHKLQKIVTKNSKYPRRSCRVCSRRNNKRSETRYLCKSCKVPLHSGECFEQYHTLEHYWKLDNSRTKPQLLKQEGAVPHEESGNASTSVHQNPSVRQNPSVHQNPSTTRKRPHSQIAPDDTISMKPQRKKSAIRSKGNLNNHNENVTNTSETPSQRTNQKR